MTARYRTPDLMLCPARSGRSPRSVHAECLICIRNVRRWGNLYDLGRPSVSLTQLYDPAKLSASGSCGSLITGHPAEVGPDG